MQNVKYRCVKLSGGEMHGENTDDKYHRNAQITNRLRLKIYND